MGEEIGDYYLGLDIGTSSVGWAVTDPEYNILNYRRKALWGIHLFEEGKTAEERRQHRCARRRLTRRKQRISLLRELFGKEIIKVDPGFFERFSRRKSVFTAGFPKYVIKRSLSDRVVRERDSEANAASFSKEASQRQFL